MGIKECAIMKVNTSHYHFFGFGEQMTVYFKKNLIKQIHWFKQINKEN